MRRGKQDFEPVAFVLELSDLIQQLLETLDLVQHEEELPLPYPIIRGVSLRASDLLRWTDLERFR